MGLYGYGAPSYVNMAGRPARMASAAQINYAARLGGNVNGMTMAAASKVIAALVAAPARPAYRSGWRSAVAGQDGMRHTAGNAMASRPARAALNAAAIKAQSPIVNRAAMTAPNGLAARVAAFAAPARPAARYDAPGSALDDRGWLDLANRAPAGR